MDSLKNFISECGEAKSAAGVEPVALVEAVTNTGTLLITACNDFENATSKTPLGLEEPHVIQLPGTIRQCFSSSSSFHSFILSGEGKLYAFGRNDRGQLGTGDLVTYSYPVELPNIGLFPAGSKIIKIATGRSHSLILLESGDVYGCGANTQGQLGLGDSKVAIRDSLRFVKILSLVAIRDISCGYDHSIVCDRSGRLLTFGHPQYGQLGHGTDGSFIKDGGKGAAMQFRCIFSPRQIEKFVVKDSHGKLQTEVPASEVNIRLVAAGKNHSVCVEEWENNGRNKVYSFGFGGYGRLGHNSGTDEFYPREITTFQSIVGGQQVTSENFPQKQIHQIVAGSTYTMAISKSKHLYFWGKLSNSQRGEAVMYPKMEMNLYGWNTRHCAGGSNSVFVAADASCVAWGVPVAGKFGFEGGARSSVSAKLVESIGNLNTLDISCGYGHVCFVVNGATLEAQAKIAAFPVLPAPSVTKAVSSSASATATAAKETKKRSKATVEDTEPATKKKGKGK